MRSPLHSRELEAPRLRETFDDTVATLAALGHASAWVVSGTSVRALRLATYEGSSGGGDSKAAPPPDGRIIAAADEACESGRTRQSGELWAVPWTFAGQRGAYVLTAIDAAAVSFIERTIARAREFARVETALDALGEGMLVVAADGAIELATARAGELLGTTPEALEGTSLNGLFPIGLPLEPGEIVRGAVAGSAVHFIAHHQAPRSGESEADRPLGLVVRLRSDERFAASRQRQTQLLATLRHDVRSPLTSLRGIVSVLLDEPDMPRDERLGLVELLRQEAERTITWVEDYLVVLRLRLDSRPQHVVPCDLGALLTTLSRLYERHADERRVTFTVEARTGAPTSIQAEAALLETFGRSVVGHAFRLADAGATIAVTTLPEGGLEVRGRGPGLFGSPPSQPFTTLSRSTAAGKRTPGIGLGLFLAKKIADVHGWRLEVEHTADAALVVRTRW